MRNHFLVITIAFLMTIVLPAIGQNEGSKIVKSILSKVSMDGNIPPIVESTEIPNAQAIQKNGTTYLLYNPNFIKQLNANSQAKWAAYSVFAHEIGHLVLPTRHNFSETDARKRKENELEADIFSGRVLARFEAPREQATSGLNGINWKHIQPAFYPDSTKRANAILRGYDEEKKKMSDERNSEKTKISLNSERKNIWNKLNTPPSAEIDDEKIVVELNTANIGDFPYYKVCLISNNSNVVPRTVEGLGVFTKDKLPQKVVWYYRRDKVSKENASLPNLLSAYIYDINALPRQPNNAAKVVEYTILAGGIGLFITGGIKTIKSLNIYEPYNDIRNPNDPFYKTESRTNLYKRANGEWLNARIMFGGAALLGGTWYLIHCRHQKRKNANSLLCLPAQPKRFEWSPLVASDAAGASVGVRWRF